MKRYSKIAVALVLTLTLLVAGSSCSSDEGKRLPLGTDNDDKVVPEARFTSSPQSGIAPLTVHFTDQSTGEINGWEWDFDNDGTIDSTEQSPSHIYETSGTYSVSLKVTGANGSDTETKVEYIEVESSNAETSDETDPPDAVDPDPVSIIGEWELFRTSGGFAGVNETRELTGEPSVAFDEYGNFIRYNDGIASDPVPYTIEIAKTIFSLDPESVIVIGTPGEGYYTPTYAYSFEMGGKILYLTENVYDGFCYEYRRISGSNWGDESPFPDLKLELAVRKAIGKLQGDISPSDLAVLTVLRAQYDGIFDLTGLELCTSLTELNLGGNEISDISALSGLTNLTSVYLYGNQITDISPLSGLINLTELGLSGNQISDISALSGLTNLTEIYLKDNQISNLSPLSSLTSIRKLELSYNKISDISPLSSSINLIGLNLNDNEISDLSPLSSLTNLMFLELGRNQISDLSPLASLTGMSRLELWDNQISDLSPLSSLTSVRSLVLENNQISDLSPLTSLTSLNSLDLRYNEISDIKPLFENPSLGQDDMIYLAHNPLSPTSVSTYIPALEERGVWII